MTVDDVQLTEIRTDRHVYVASGPRLPDGEFRHECDGNDCRLREELRRIAEMLTRHERGLMTWDEFWLMHRSGRSEGDDDEGR